MRKIKKYLSNLFSWIESILFFLYWIIAHIFKSDLKNHIVKDKSGETIDIIVNGPSFAKQAESVKGDGFDKCMVNFAANTPLFWEMKPEYYCVSDPAFFRNPKKNDKVIKFIKNICMVKWNMTFFVTYYDYKKHIKNTDLINNKYVKFVPYHSTPIPFSFKFRKLAFWLFRNGQAMPNPTSVSVPVIMNLINKGYSCINLYGYDQDWIHNVVVDKNNQVCLQDTHFYNEKGIYRPWKKNDIECFTMFEIMRSQAELFETYWFIREYVNSTKITKVINMSDVSLIDAFDRFYKE